MAGVNNFEMISLEELDLLPRKIKKNKRIIIDLSSNILIQIPNMSF